MFIEEDFETYAVNLVKQAQDAANVLYDDALASVKSVQLFAHTDLGLQQTSDGQTVISYTGSVPAIIMGVTPEMDALKELNTKGDSQYIGYAFRVFVLSQGFDAPNAAVLAARPILRAVRNLFRGLRWTSTDGASEGMGRVYFSAQSLAAEASGVALTLQEYTIKTPDHNTTTRAL